MRKIGGKPPTAHRSGSGGGSSRKPRSFAGLGAFLAFSAQPRSAGPGRRARSAAAGGFWHRIETCFGLAPRRWGLLASVTLWGLAGAYAASLNGAVQASAAALLEASRPLAEAISPAIERIDISGVPEARRIDVLAALEAGRGDAILWFDAGDARMRLEKLAWVKSARVQRLLPGTVKISIEGRAPYAIWQRDGELTVIDREGVVIADARGSDFARLPLVVGEGANRHAGEFLALLERWPSLRPRLRAAVRVADRRWNLRLINGVDIRLPENNVASAIDELAALDETYGLLQRDIVAIDLRLGDRITIRLSDEAAMRRDAAIKGRTKPARKNREADT